MLIFHLLLAFPDSCITQVFIAAGRNQGFFFFLSNSLLILFIKTKDPDVVEDLV